MSSSPRFTTILPAADNAGVLSALPLGTRVGAYVLGEVLGRGGFGITYEAVETQSGTIVAIKEFFPENCARVWNGDGSEWEIRAANLAHSEAFEMARAQFLDGARALQNIRHRSLARVIAPLEAHGTVYLVMERLRGQTLLQWLDISGTFSPNTTLQIAHDLAEALDAMHRLGFLHLDVKPENVMTCADDVTIADVPASTCGRVVLFDFDLLQRIENTGGLGTRPLSTHCGTPGYAPLEQYAQQAQLSPATDLYALGATLWHLLIGAPPLSATDRALQEQLARAGEPDAVFSARALDMEIDENFDGALSWALEMSPRERPQNVKAWLEALKNGRAKVAVAPSGAEDSDAAFLMAAPIAPTANSLSAAPISASLLAAPRLPNAPAVPVLAPLPQVDGWYQIVARENDFDWPHECACCGKTPDSYFNVRAAGAKWAIPYCRRCARHVRAGRQAVWGASWGMATGVAIAFAAFLISDIWLGPIGVMLHFGAMAYGILKIQAAEAIMRDRCCDRKMSVAFGGMRETVSGRKYLVRFLNLHYAHQWKARNAGKL